MRVFVCLVYVCVCLFDCMFVWVYVCVCLLDPMFVWGVCMRVFV